MHAPVLGIDFGTTNTSAAWIAEDGSVELVRCGEASYVLPSVVWHGPRGQVLVGGPARKMLLDDPRNTVFGVKRFLGRRYMTDFVARNRSRVAFSLVPDQDGMTAAEVGGAIRPLDAIAADIFRRILELAAVTAHRRFHAAVVTVPAHYGVRQRNAIRSAAERAGVDVVAMVNEPTAAALYYARARGDAAPVLVFDLGGGTFDATLMAIHDGVVRVLGSSGDAFLGGSDFDYAFGQELLQRFQERTGVDPGDDPIAVQRVVLAAEAAKIELSEAPSSKIRVPCIAMIEDRFLDLEDEVDVPQLERVTAPLIEKTLGICEDLLASVDLTPANVAELVFVGGQTRMPAIRRRLGQRFRTEPTPPVHPDVGVAVGAALLGHHLEKPAASAGLVDVVSVPLGVAIPGRPPLEVISANTPVPCRRAVRLPVTQPDKPFAFAIYEALRATSTDREVLGLVRIEPDTVRGATVLTVELRVSRSFALAVFLHTDDGTLPLPIEAPAVQAEGGVRTTR